MPELLEYLVKWTIWEQWKKVYPNLQDADLLWVLASQKGLEKVLARCRNFIRLTEISIAKTYEETLLAAAAKPKSIQRIAELIGFSEKEIK